MNRLKIILAENKTLHEMLIGICLSNVVVFVIAMIFAGDKVKASVGILIGTVLALMYCIHMAVTIDDALCLDEKGASAQMRKHMLIRYSVVCVVVALVCVLKIGNPVLIVISCLTVKFGAYLQPLVHKLMKRWR